MKIDLSNCIRKSESCSINVMSAAHNEQSWDPSSENDNSVQNNQVGGYFPPTCANPYPLIYGEVPITEEQMNSLAMTERRMGINVSAKETLQSMTTVQKVSLLEKSEEIRQNRHLYTDGLYFNQYGFLCRERIKPNGRVLNSTQICPVANLKLTIFYSVKGEKRNTIYMISYSRNENHEFLFIPGNKFSISRLYQKMLKQGVTIQFTADSKERILGLFWNLLLNNAEKTELPMSTGWNKIGGKWEWIPEGTLTFEEVNSNV